jgi:hypothetical protein
MGHYIRTYRDDTHTYRLAGASIVMREIGGGSEHTITFDRADQARGWLRWVIERGRLRRCG